MEKLSARDAALALQSENLAAAKSKLYTVQSSLESKSLQGSQMMEQIQRKDQEIAALQEEVCDKS